MTTKSKTYNPCDGMERSSSSMSGTKRRLAHAKRLPVSPIGTYWQISYTSTMTKLSLLSCKLGTACSLSLGAITITTTPIGSAFLWKELATLLQHGSWMCRQNYVRKRTSWLSPPEDRIAVLKTKRKLWNHCTLFRSMWMLAFFGIDSNSHSKEVGFFNPSLVHQFWPLLFLLIVEE